MLLFAAAVAALIISNSAWQTHYDSFIHYKIPITVGIYSTIKPIEWWINDGLMSLFFLLVGLEIKREIFHGALNKPDRILLPALGALGGLIGPAIIYFIFNYDSTTAIRGWAIPTATDIAFSLGILSLLGRRVPIQLKIFLTALAIIDDIAAIFIIAVYYTENISLAALNIAILSIATLTIMNRAGMRKLTHYFIIGFILWLSLYNSGIHPTLAGIVLAMAIPLTRSKHSRISPLVTLEHSLLPWVTYLILPIFAFANTGINFDSLTISKELMSIPLGITLGLIFGKPIGIMSTCWLLIYMGWSKKLKDVSWLNLLGVTTLCGVGFTMSLFIGALAFDSHDPHYSQIVRFGVICGSVPSGLLGYLILYFTLPSKNMHKPVEIPRGG